MGVLDVCAPSVHSVMLVDSIPFLPGAGGFCAIELSIDSLCEDPPLIISRIPKLPYLGLVFLNLVLKSRK